MSAKKKPIPFDACGKYFGLGHDIECCNGVLMDIDEYTEGYQRDTVYHPCQCNPNRCMRCGGVGRVKPTNGDWTAIIECRTCGGTGWKKSIGYQPPDNRYDDSANDPLPVTAIPAIVRQFVMDAGYLIVSAAAAPHGSMENRALRRSWLAAIAELGMGEEDARSGEIGLWKRGFPAGQNEEDGA